MDEKSGSNKWDGALPENLTPTEDDAKQLARFASFLDSCRGDEAIEASGATDFRVRRLHQAREEAFHRIGLLVREYATRLAACPACVSKQHPDYHAALRTARRAGATND